MKQRLYKVNTLIKKELGTILQQHVDLPRDLLATITHVKTSVDLKYATVYLSVLPAKKAPSTLVRLNKRLAYLQRLLNQRLVMRPLPQLRLTLDQGEKHAAKIEKILAQEKRFGQRSVTPPTTS